MIKLTAQYTAASGRQFLAGLAQREQRNPQFDFLKPTHMLFSYFTALVDAYTKVGRVWCRVWCAVRGARCAVDRSIDRSSHRRAIDSPIEWIDDRAIDRLDRLREE